MLQNGKVTAFNVSELLKENQQGWGVGGKIPTPSQIRVKSMYFAELLRTAALLRMCSKN